MKRREEKRARVVLLRSDEIQTIIKTVGAFCSDLLREECKHKGIARRTTKPALPMKATLPSETPPR